MKFTSEQLQLFLEDKAFYNNKECYCLGNSFEEAAKIVTEIVKERDGESGKENVGLAL